MGIRETFYFAELEGWLNERRVTEIECLVPDLTGVARGKILPREKFSEDRGMRLPDVVLGMTVTGNAPESAEYDAVISELDHDMILRPDASTVCLVPWAVDPTAQVIHDCFKHDGTLVPYAPRTVLRHVLELYSKKGFRQLWQNNRPKLKDQLKCQLVHRCQTNAYCHRKMLQN